MLDDLKEKGIAIRVASPKLVQEEVNKPRGWIVLSFTHAKLASVQAPDSYKNVTDVVETCHAAGISKLCVKLRPVAVIKG